MATKSARQILLNFVGNAVKFTERGRILMQCRIVRSDDERLTIRFNVSDTGIGLTSDLQVPTGTTAFTKTGAQCTGRGQTLRGRAFCEGQSWQARRRVPRP